MKVIRLTQPFKSVSIFPRMGVIAVVAMLLSSLSYGTSSFQGLGLSKNSIGSMARGVSNDGRTVVGHDTLFDYKYGELQSFLWTAADGKVPLSRLPGGDEGNWSGAISGDGQTVVGTSDSTDYGRAVRWQNGSIESLGLLEEINETYGSYSQAFGVSNNGSVVVGTGSVPDHFTEAFRWTQNSGMIGLGFLSELDRESGATGVSADGRAIVGYSSRPRYGEAFRWTQEEGMQGLGHLGNGTHSRAYAVSDDGKVVVGQSFSNVGQQAFRWEDGKMIGLGFLDDSSRGFSFATTTSGDGRLVGGYTENYSRPDNEIHKAFIWDEVNGMQSMQSFLTGHGLDLEGWKIIVVGDMTPDGLTFVGSGLNPDGKLEAWIAHIPEPATLLFLSIGSMLISRRRHLST